MTNRSMALLFTAATLSAAPFVDAAPHRQAESAPAASAAPAPRGDEDQVRKREDILRLFQLNGVKRTAEVQLEAMSKSFVAMPGMTPEIMQAVREELAANLDQLLEISVKAYAAHLSHDDIKELIAFAETPLGQRMAAAQPLILADATAASTVWGQKLQIRIMRRAGELREKAQQAGDSDPR
jgi:hypothetical protein